MKALRVGTFVLPNGTHVWVVRHLTPISDQLREIISRTASAMVNRLGVSEDHSVYRADLQGTSDSLRFFVEIAVTLHDPALPA